MVSQALFRRSARLLFLFCLGTVLRAQDIGCFWGRVVDADGIGKPAANVILILEGRKASWTAVGDQNGHFQIPGLPRGTFRLRCKTPLGVFTTALSLDIGESENIYVRIRLPPSDSPHQGIIIESLLRNYADVSSSTRIDERQLGLLPSANSVWTLIENQDFSATTSRIDVGGLWTSSPLAFSARGGTSWTQNSLKLNGMSITDPYWGGLPLIIPDFWSFQTYNLGNAGHSAEILSPGGVLDLRTKEGGESFKGTASAYYSNKLFSSRNITQALKKERLYENDLLKDSFDGRLSLSGPLVPGKLYFFTSWSALKIVRDIAEFSADDKSVMSSGLVQMRYEAGQSRWSFLWAGQENSHPTLGADRNVPFISTLNQKNFSHIFQTSATFRLNRNHLLTAGVGYGRTDSYSRFQDGATGQPGIEIFRLIPSGPAAAGGESRRDLMTFSVHGHLFGLKNGTSHHFEYGTEWTKASATIQEQIPDNIQLRFFNGLPLEVARFDAPIEHRESLLEASTFFQETLTLKSLLSMTVGLHLNYSRGWAPGEKTAIKWFNAAPRIGFVVPLSKSGRTSLKLFAGRYYFNLPLSELAYGNPRAPGALVYAWDDKNRNRLFNKGEAGRLIRREGPFYARIDPSLKRPSTDELSIGYVRRSGSGFFFSLTGFFRETRNLIETINTGVPFSSYEKRTVYDIGDDRIPNTHDDLDFTLFNQSEASLGQDFFWLTNPGDGQRRSRYWGLDLIFYKKTSTRFSFFIALTATQAVGTTNPGNTEWENDDGVIGSLYDNPNSLINAKGRLRFDRAYTARIGFTVRLPLGLHLGYVAKYYDGQPFARKIIITGFRQGPFTIMAHPRGVARYEYNMTHDFRLQKSIVIGGGSLRIILDGFNIFNQNLATGENEWTGDDFPLRFATEVESPRIFRLGLSYEF